VRLLSSIEDTGSPATRPKRDTVNMKITAQLKNIRVDFDGSVDTRPFNQNALQQIRKNGMYLTELALIHCASVQYQSRFSNSIARRLRYTLDTIEPSIMGNTNGEFFFSDEEESELQKSSSEVIGVGFAVHLIQRLLDVKFGEISRIPVNNRRKHCDFEVLKNGLRYIIESKGRKTNITGAKEEIRGQKREYPNCVKYGVVTHIPRDGRPCSMHVTDPDIEFPEVSWDYQVIAMLEHYSKVARLAGFYRISEVLNKRIEEIHDSKGMASPFNNKVLDFGDITKVGRVIDIAVLGKSFTCFFYPNLLELGLKWYFKDGSMLVFGVDKTIMESLRDQDFQRLLEYRFVNEDKGEYSALDDGTLVTTVSKQTATEAMKR